MLKVIGYDEIDTNEITNQEGEKVVLIEQIYAVQAPDGAITTVNVTIVARGENLRLVQISTPGKIAHDYRFEPVVDPSKLSFETEVEKFCLN
jgi:hypothetical protein